MKKPKHKQVSSADGDGASPWAEPVWRPAPGCTGWSPPYTPPSWRAGWGWPSQTSSSAGQWPSWTQLWTGRRPGPGPWAILALWRAPGCGRAARSLAPWRRRSVLGPLPLPGPWRHPARPRRGILIPSNTKKQTIYTCNPKDAWDFPTLCLTFHLFHVFWMTAAALSHLFTFLLTSHDRTAAEEETPCLIPNAIKTNFLKRLAFNRLSFAQRLRRLLPVDQTARSERADTKSGNEATEPPVMPPCVNWWGC